MKPETFYSLLAEQNLPLSDQQKNQFERYFELLVEWNEKINLTAITDKEEVLVLGKVFCPSMVEVNTIQIQLLSQKLKEVNALIE